MPLFNLDVCRYFFGTQFNPKVVDSCVNGSISFQEILREVDKTIEKGEMHMGIQMICFTDVDTGLFSCQIMKSPTVPSYISMYAQSRHRLWGCSSLVCVPLAFCIDTYQHSGEYDVYRHTYKRPNFTQDEIADIMRNGSEKERIKTFAFIKSREGYETIEGKSYVGITRQTWQKRYNQHIEDAVEKKSSRKFHESIREMQGKYVILVHDIVACAISYKDALKIEKNLIKESTLWPKGLNMRA